MRTIQQFNQWATVAVLSSDPTIVKAVRGQQGVHLVQAEDKSAYYGGIDMIRKGLTHAWNRRSIILFGDVVWTDEAVEIVRQHQTDEWAVYGRSEASELTAPWAEYFGIEITWGSRKRAREVCDPHVI